MRMKLLQLIDVCIKEVCCPLHEEVATLKLLLAHVHDYLEPTEACISGGLGLTAAHASFLHDSTEQKSSLVEKDHLYGISPRGSSCLSPQPVVLSASESDKLCEEYFVELPLELGTFKAMVVASAPSPSQKLASVEEKC
jgi:hypothetical protein